jgi:hypothetical protein
MSDFRFNKQRYVDPKELGMADVPCNAIKTSSTLDITGANKLTLLCFFTRVAGTGNIDLVVDAYDVYKNDWVILQATATAAGVVTMSDAVYRKATGSVSQKYEIRLTDLNFTKIRIRLNAAVAAAGASDLLDVAAIVSYSN